MKKYYLLLVLLSVVLTGCVRSQKEFIKPSNEQCIDSISISLLIKTRIEKSWSRPEPEIQGLKVKVQVEAKRDGSLISARIIKPSGNRNFDRSALDAINNVFPQKEFTRMKYEEYEKNFKKFKLVFKSV